MQTRVPALMSVSGKAEPAWLGQTLARLGVKSHLPAWREVERDFILHPLDRAAIVSITDATGTIFYANDKFCESSGFLQKDLIGANHRILKSGKHDANFYRAMYHEITRGHIWHGEVCNRHKDGSLHWFDTTIIPQISNTRGGNVYTSIRFDISARKQLEEELRKSRDQMQRLANLDPLTEIPNRRSFEEHVASLIAEHSGSVRHFHLALLDLDRFKVINDSFGHVAADEVLKTVASRLRKVAGQRLFVARLGGDEFGLVLHGATISEADALFAHVQESIRQPFQNFRAPRRCSASLGRAIFPRDGADCGSLYRAADLALYRAKALGRDRCELFRPILKEMADRRAELFTEIENGLRAKSFTLHYQPIVSLDRSQNVSLEALMRWQHPKQGLLTPAAFRDGFSNPAVCAAFGMFLLEQVFRDVAALRNARVPLDRVAVNVTNPDFRSGEFVDRFFALTEKTGIDPKYFCIEVTEGMFLDQGQAHVECGLQRLHQAGVEVALDDFGTGHASLRHLRDLPIDRLKIDRSFVANLATSKQDRILVRGLIDIAHSLGKSVTAEGVETDQQVAILSRMNCDRLQGWFFGKACSVNDLPELLKQIPQVDQPSTINKSTVLYQDHASKGLMLHHSYR